MQKVRNIELTDKYSGEVMEVIDQLPYVKHQYNNHLFPKHREKNSQKSLTVPNMAMTVRELIARFASGMPLDIGKAPVYDNGQIPDIDDMDLIERHEYYKILKQRKAEAEDRVVKARTEAEKIKMEKIVAERVAAREKEIEQKVLEEFRKKRQGGNE